MKRFITLKDNKVISIRNGSKIVPGEIESEKGNLGQLLQSDGSFIDDPIEIAIQAYEIEKDRAIADLNNIQDEILLGMATQTDLDNRRAAWLEYHTANNPY